MLHGAAAEVANSLKTIGGLAKQTGATMVDWNERELVAANGVATAYERYATVVERSNKLIVNAAQDQSIAWKFVVKAHEQVAAAARLQAQAEADLALIANRAYDSEIDRMSLVNAANDRLAYAIGLRTVATRDAVVADLALADADRAAALAAETAATRQELAKSRIAAAYKEQAAVATAQSMVAVNALRGASAMAMSTGTGFLVAGAAIGAGLLFAAGKAGDFTSEIILLHTQARVATDQLPELRAGILGMAGDVGFSADKLAKALFLIESVGGGSATAAHALRELQAAAMGAAVGHADLIQTANVLASVMAVFPKLLPIQAMGQLDAIVGQGKMTMEELNGAMRTGILATLHSAGITLADFGGALATMTDYAIPAVQAANSLRMAIYLMSAPTLASDKVLKQFGLTTKEVSSISQEWTNKIEAAGIRHAQLADDLRKPNGIIVALQDLRSHLIAAGLSAEGQAETIYKAFGGGKMGKAVITLYENIAGGAGASRAELIKLGFTELEIATLHDRLIQKTGLINQQTNLLGQNFAYLQSHDPAQMWKDFTSAVNALWLALGTAFIPVLIATLQLITPVVQAITRWVAGHEDLVRMIGITVVTLLSAFGAALLFVGILGSIAGSILAIGAASEVIVPLVTIFFGVFVGAAAAMVTVVGIATSAWGYLSNFWDTRVTPSAQRLWNVIGSVWTVIQEGLAIVRPLFESAFNSFASRLSAQGGLWSDATAAFQGWTKEVLNFVKSPVFATLVADFAVTLPTALGLTLDSLLLVADTVQIIFATLISVSRVAMDVVTGNFTKAIADFASGNSEIMRLQNRLLTDMSRTQDDFAKTYDDTNSKMWQQVYNNTMDATSKIGADGAINLTTSGQRLQAANEKLGIHLKPIAYRTFYDVGANMAQGVDDGIASKRAQIDDKIAKLSAPKPQQKGIAGRTTAGPAAPVMQVPEVSGFERFTSTIGGFFNDLGTSVNNFWTDFQSHPAYSIGLAAGSIFGGLMIIRGGFQDFFRLLVTGAGDGIQGFVNTMAAGLQKSLIDTINWGKGIYNSVSGWVQRLPALIRTYVDRAGNAIIAWMQSSYASVISGWGRITNWLSTTWNELPGKIKSLGQQIVEGLWEGMNSKGAWLIKQGQDFFNGFVKGVKDKLGITSPSKLFALQIGQPLVQGVWMGAQSQQPMLQENFGRMIAELSSSPISTSLVPNMALSSPSFRPLPLHSIQSIQRSEETHTYEPSGQNNQPTHTTVHSDTKIKLMLDDKIIAEAVDKKTHEILMPGLNVQ